MAIIIQTAVIALVALLFVLMAMRIFSPFGRRLEGTILLEIKLRFMERLLIHRWNIMGILALLFVADILRAPVYFMVQLAAYVMIVVLLMLPSSYVFTSLGLGFNSGSFRQWSEFKTSSVRGRKLVLQGKKGHRSVSLFLSRESADQVLKLVKKSLKKA